MVLERKINKDAASDRKKIVNLFKWTYNNIRKQPKDLPVVDGIQLCGVMEAAISQQTYLQH